MLLAGCASSSGGLASRVPENTGVKLMTLESRGFTLAAAQRLTHSNPAMAGESVRIFIEGDGRPWILGGRQISDDPTPRHTPMLEAFLDSPAPSLYLGRPCYFEMGPATHCNPALWTFSRYSNHVINAMTEAAESWLSNRAPGARVTLIGHSGGGVLSLLIGERMPAVDHVITYAAPVDINRWSEIHSFTPLFDSINPADINDWRPEVSRLLIFGGQDNQVPPASFTPSASRIPDARISIMSEEGHLPPVDFIQ